VDPLLIERHPAALATAGRLGYSGTDVDIGGLRERYNGAPDEGLDRIGRFEGSPSR
jgi:hypothetical protein